MLLFEEVKKVEEFLISAPSENNHYTGYLYNDIIESNLYVPPMFATSMHMLLKTNNNNQNGQRFEGTFQLYLQKKYNFIIIGNEYRKEDYKEIDMYSHDVLRVLRKDVPMSTLENVINANVGKKINIKRISKTEFVLEIWNAKPTLQFPLSSFDSDGCLRIRVECKTQSVDGSADKKIPGCIFDLKYGSKESNIIFLMTGSYFSDMHYEMAKFFSSNDWSNSHCKIPYTNMHVMNERDFAEWSEAAMG